MRHHRSGGLAQAIILGNTPTHPWTPLPPGSYNSSGTIVTTQLESSIGGAGSGLGQQTFFPTWQHVTATPSGDIFTVANYYDDNATAEHTVCKYRLKWSSNLGASFTTIYDTATAGDPLYGLSPHIESDRNNNVYLVHNCYPRDANPSKTLIRKFAPPFNQTYTAAGTLLQTISQSSNKYSAFYDQKRDWIWICYWQDSTAANLYAVDLTGAVRYSQNIFNAKPGVELYGTATYPCLSMSIDGTLIVGWSTESSELLGVQGYYEARMMASTNGGTSFIGPGGAITLPVYTDDSYPAANRSAWTLINPGTDFLAGTDPNYGTGAGQHYNWNHLYNLAFNNGKLHGMYESESSSSAIYGGEHHTHVRFDWPTKAIDYRRQPFDSDAGDAGNGGTSFHTNTSNGGCFVQDTSQTGRLYYVANGRADQSKVGKLVVFKCDNPAATTPVWTTYAQASTSLDAGGGNGLVNITACRWVQSDGSIIGICQQADSPYGIYFFRVA